MRAGGSSWIVSSKPQSLAGRAASFILIATIPQRLVGAQPLSDRSYISLTTPECRCHVILGLQIRNPSLGEMR